MSDVRNQSSEQPFARAQAQAFRDGQPYLGGQIRILSGALAANANYAVPHNLRVTPRFVWLLDAGTTGITGPLPRGATAWNSLNVYLNLPAVAAGQNLTLLIA